MEHLLTVFIAGHVVAGFVGLVAFWVPVVTRKGGGSHVRYGHVFAWCAYLVTLSAVVVSLARVIGYQLRGITVTEQPEAYGFALFLGYLGLATFASVRQSIRAVETRREPEQLKTPFHQTLAYLSIAGSITVIVFAFVVWTDVSLVLLALSPVGLFTGRRMLALMRAPRAEHMGWFFSHMGAMIGAGIAFHTAFGVFGAQRLWEYELAGVLGVVPWVAPAIVGIPALAFTQAYYRRRFEKAQATSTATV